MKVAVWDTYVPKRSGEVMHFDINVPAHIRDTTIIFGYGQEYLTSKGQEGQPLSTKECQFCHVETIRPDWDTSIREEGYYIVEMENCNP